jgi:hypothetical protein
LKLPLNLSLKKGEAMFSPFSKGGRGDFMDKGIITKKSSS